MRRMPVALIVVAVLAVFCAAPVQATTISLFDYGFNVDGAVFLNGDPLPSTIDASLFNFTLGQGTLIARLGPGSHLVVAYFDHEIDEEVNTYFNEYGVAVGTPGSGVSWEIDEPGFREVNPGDIYTNFLAGMLDNSNGVPSSGPDDVAMAMGWMMNVNAGDLWTLTLKVSDLLPSEPFYLSQVDPDSGATIYFSATSSVGGAGIPEPATFLLGAAGLIALGAYRRRGGKQDR